MSLLPISRLLIGLLIQCHLETYESSWGHALIFCIVLSAHTLVRWVNENAFAFIVQARPCPIFGRPVHQRDGSLRLQPDTSPQTLQIPFHNGHLVFQSIAASGFRFFLSVSSFRLCAHLDSPYLLIYLWPARRLLPLLDTTLLIRAPEGLEPS